MKRFFVALSLMVMISACSKPPAKTEDPAEIEKLRQKHQSMAEREKADNG